MAAIAIAGYNTEGVTGMAYAIIDTATTGLDKREHSVLELAIITTDDSFHETGRFETIIDPQSDDLGLTSMHKLEHHDVRGAPTFHQLAPTIAGILDGNILVAHNLHFHQRFVSNELEMAGVEHDPGDGICTLELAVAEGWPLKRQETARYLGVEDGGPDYSSLRDAIRCLGIARHGSNLGGRPFTSKIRHVGLPVEPKLRKRTGGRVAQRDRFASTSEAATTYLLRLHEYLGSDGELDGGERADLSRLAKHVGLDRSQVLELQNQYIKYLVDRASTAANQLELPEPVINLSEWSLDSATPESIEIGH